MLDLFRNSLLTKSAICLWTIADFVYMCVLSFRVHSYRATCGWKIMFCHCKDTSGVINDQVQLKIKYSFLYFLILYRPLVLIACIRTYIIIYNQWSCHKKSLSHRRGSATENYWLATNFSGNHLPLTCGHSHLCAYKVSVFATCDCYK